MDAMMGPGDLIRRDRARAEEVEQRYNPVLRLSGHDPLWTHSFSRSSFAVCLECGGDLQVWPDGETAGLLTQQTCPARTRGSKL